jgi:regulator of protease activity HflC (stomatin/prohibitin superfamily)
MIEYFGLGTVIILAFFLIWLWNSIYILKEWERGVVLRLGRLMPVAKGAGVRVVFWPIETLYRISLRLETMDVPPQDIITRDNVSVKVNAVCYFESSTPIWRSRKSRILLTPPRNLRKPRYAAL